MNRKNMTRNALITSILSLLLCVSMLVSTTFAWFTDEVTSGRNTIAAGNLDIELLVGGDENKKVNKDTVLFDNQQKWEPGVVVYEDLQIANVGTLALKYQLTLDIIGENNLNGHKLSEVVKIAVLDRPVAQIVDPSKTAAEQRAAVMAAAKASVATTNGFGVLDNFFLQGSLTAGEKTPVVGVVIFWEPNANEIDNLYNANNGQKTSDGKPLFIEFGVNLQATQLMHENDSFGNDYDEFASLLPKATVNNTGKKTIQARPFEQVGNASSARPIDLDVSYQFLPNEEATYSGNVYDLIAGNIEMDSAYRYWHADWVVSTDRPIRAESAVLAGYYRIFGEMMTGTDWVSLTADLAANTPVRLLNDGMGGTFVNYQMICAGADDGIGFLCGAADLTGENAGTTLSVELRLYETTIDPLTNSGSQNIETGEYITVGKFSYTFGAVEVETAAELQEAINNNLPEIKLAKDIDLGTTSITVPNGVTTTLDLNGYKVSGVCNAVNGTAFTVNNGATLNVKDSRSNGKISYAAGAANQGYAVKLLGTLNLYSGTIELTGDWSDGICYAVDVAPNVWGGTANDAVFNMYGGKLVSSKDAIRVANYSATGYATMKAGFNMEGGEVIAARDGIFVQQHSATQFDLFVTVTDGTIKANVRPIRVYGPNATGTLSGNAQSMTITAKAAALVLDGTVDTSMTWHTEGKIAIGGGMTVDNLNQYANITLN